MMSNPADNGWSHSAHAWLAQQGEAGDWGRTAVLDSIMVTLALAAGGRFLDIGCGEGRFVRMLAAAGLSGAGIDPTELLIKTAQERDPGGDYRAAGAEALPFEDGSFDLAVFYLSLIDIADLAGAVQEANRVLRPGGTLLIANLSSINTAGRWHKDWRGRGRHFAVDDYTKVRQIRQRWAGIDIVNWHRPFETYFTTLLGAGLVLREFREPQAQPAARRNDKFDRVPNFVVMRWEKPI